MSLPRICLVLRLSLVGALLLGGCRRNDSETTQGSTSEPNAKSSSPANSSNALAAPAVSTLPTSFSVPFRGVIKAREQRDLLLNHAEITYTIGERKIRREARRTAPLGKLADLGQGSAGVICDLQAERVVFYRSDLAKKRFSSMALSEYRKLAAAAGGAPGGAGQVAPVLAGLAAKPSLAEHVGTFFVEAAATQGQAVNRPEARSVNGLPCDVWSLQSGNTIFEACHCQRIRVDRPLLELVELRLPAQVTGFPCLMRRLQQVPVAAADETADKSRQLLQKGARWAANVAERALKREVELLHIVEGAPPDSAFTLDKTFVECPSLEELHRQFEAAEGHHHDWD